MLPEENEIIDATEELMTVSEENNIANVRSAMDLKDVAYEDMSEEERKYYISALKMREQELDSMLKNTLKNNQKAAEDYAKSIAKVEDTLTFIKSTVGNAYGAISLAIKNLEREVN